MIEDFYQSLKKENIGKGKRKLLVLSTLIHKAMSICGVLYLFSIVYIFMSINFYPFLIMTVVLTIVLSICPFILVLLDSNN